ncbi:AAA domain-containing protein [Neobacillus sp. SM06]|uniref:AAA domain-containing protein n=1 Tax=Neobacillus sp. SM06 TaxID=3422492 RepID=UPI003D266EC3
MTTSVEYIKEWQQALQNEIMHLKKFGSNKMVITNGRLVTAEGSFTYYFDTAVPLKIPAGSSIRLEWGSSRQQGRVLSAEGSGIILSLERSFGDLIGEAHLYHDPWELLEQLILRLDETKKSKQKRLRIKKLMDPSMPPKHPVEKISGTIHELLLRSKYNPVTFVWGPPGTGKTYTLARTAAHKYFKEKRVLLLSHSNQAVDVLVSEISTFIEKKGRIREGDVLRYGNNSGETFRHRAALTTSQLLEKEDPLLAQNRTKLVDERRQLKQDLGRSFSKRDSEKLLELETKIARVLEKIRQKEFEFVKDAYIVGTTLAKAASDPAIYEKEFDLVMVDEASMAYVPQVAFAATLAKRLIVSGDFKQLPPIAASRDPLVTTWLKEDIFHKSGVTESVHTGKLHPHLFLLKEQRRMHPEISAFTNHSIYQSLVGDHPSVAKSRTKIMESNPFPGRASVLVDTSRAGAYCFYERTSHSRVNLWHLLLSFQLLHEAHCAGVSSIGYVTPYRAQAAAMDLLLQDVYKNERLTADIIAATVHRFQGSERDVMVFDTVDSPPQERAGMLLTGRDSERLINVAITRTKGKFIHVTDRNFIKKHVYRGKTLRQLVDYQEKQWQVIGRKDIGSWVQNQHSRLQWMHALKLDRVFYDLTTARSVIVSLPEQTVLPDHWIEKLKQQNLTVISTNPWSELLPNNRISLDLTFPFILIDDHLLWLGLPLEGAIDIEPPSIAVRLDSEKVCEYLIRQFQVGE